MFIYLLWIEWWHFQDTECWTPPHHHSKQNRVHYFGWFLSTTFHCQLNGHGFWFWQMVQYQCLLVFFLINYPQISALSLESTPRNQRKINFEMKFIHKFALNSFFGSGFKINPQHPFCRNIALLILFDSSSWKKLF